MTSIKQTITYVKISHGGLEIKCNLPLASKSDKGCLKASKRMLVLRQPYFYCKYLYIWGF